MICLAPAAENIHIAKSISDLVCLKINDFKGGPKKTIRQMCMFALCCDEQRTGCYLKKFSLNMQKLLTASMNRF